MDPAGAFGGVVEYVGWPDLHSSRGVHNAGNKDFEQIESRRNWTAKLTDPRSDIKLNVIVRSSNLETRFAQKCMVGLNVGKRSRGR